MGGGGVHSELWRLSDVWGTRPLNFVCHCILKYFAMVPPKTFCHPQIFLPLQNIVTPSPKYFAMEPPKIFCTPSQKSFYHPTPKNVWPSHPPKYFALPPLKIFFATPTSKNFVAYCPSNAATLPPQQYVLGSASTFMLDLSVLKHLCMEKYQKFHQNRVKHLCVASL